MLRNGEKSQREAFLLPTLHALSMKDSVTVIFLAFADKGYFLNTESSNLGHSSSEFACWITSYQIDLFGVTISVYTGHLGQLNAQQCSEPGIGVWVVCIKGLLKDIAHICRVCIHYYHSRL